MRLCPNCRSGLLDNYKCGECDWSLTYNEGIPVMLSDYDAKDNGFLGYVENYDALAKADFVSQIVGNNYLNIQAEKMSEYLIGEYNSLLEVGVGQGNLLKLLRKKFPRSSITAIDISAPFIKYVEQMNICECIIANAENIPYKNEFDIVVASDILEHVINPIDFLLSANFALKDGGTLALRVPYEDNMLQYSRLLGGQYRFAHLRNFTKRNLVQILNQAGFNVIKTHFDGFSYNKLRFNKFRRLQNKIKSILVSYYGDEETINTINNIVGNAFMKPLEIVVIAKKAKTVETMNID